jgi:hypothetical protein
MVVRLTLLFLLAAALLLGETFKLFLKDGDYHLVREYQVQGDRVRYFSTERGDWEEIPKDLVDLDKTEGQRKAKGEERARQTREQDEEEQAERAMRREIEAIPMESGGYFKENDQVKALKLADYQIITDKKRKALTMISPVPIIPGKATVVIKGEHSPFVIKEDRPEFYLRLAKEEKFGIIRLTPKKNLRIVENVSIVPRVNQTYEERKQMATFEQEMIGNLYKVWPEKPLSPGEYALMEFSEAEDQEEINLMIWDFAIVGHS